MDLINRNNDKHVDVNLGRKSPPTTLHWSLDVLNEHFIKYLKYLFHLHRNSLDLHILTFCGNITLHKVGYEQFDQKQQI